MKLELKFYNRDSLTVAKYLLGKILVKNINGMELRARIVEVEAYTGIHDKACHTYGGKITPRTEVMFGRAGKLYVYLIYGMYDLLNIVTGKEGDGEAVLIRGVEPLGNLDIFSQNRYLKNYDKLTSYQRKNLTNGPGKLMKALGLNRDDNGVDLLEEEIYLIDDGYRDFEIVTSPRIGIDYAEEHAELPYRFYILGSDYVSVKWGGKYENRSICRYKGRHSNGSRAT